MFEYPEGAHVPGYTGHIPAMRTHVHGQTYANTTVHAVSGAWNVFPRMPWGHMLLGACCSVRAYLGITCYDIAVFALIVLKYIRFPSGLRNGRLL